MKRSLNIHLVVKIIFFILVIAYVVSCTMIFVSGRNNKVDYESTNNRDSVNLLNRNVDIGNRDMDTTKNK